jgi:heat shock protein HslJ
MSRLMKSVLALGGCALLAALVACSTVPGTDVAATPPREVAIAPPAPAEAAAPGAPSQSVALPPENLSGTSWLAEIIDGAAVVDRSQSTMEFLDNQRVAGSLGCNRYTGSYSADATGLRFARLASTRRMCPPALMDQETRFDAVLRATRGLRFEATGALLLLDADGRNRARLIRTDAAG